MSGTDEDMVQLARRALESQDPSLLVRCIIGVSRKAAQDAALANEPRPERGPRVDEPGEAEPRYGPPPRGYRTWGGTTAAAAPATRLRGVTALDNEPLFTALDNEPLYDRIYVGDAPGEALFFATGLGGAMWGAPPGTVSSWGKMRVDTNMPNAGRLPEPERFEVKGISLTVREDAPDAFVTWLRHETYFELRIGGGTLASHREPSWGLVKRFKTGAVLEDDLYVRPPAMRFDQGLEPVIDRNENFSCAIIASTAAPVPPERVRCILHGIHAKGVLG